MDSDNKPHKSPKQLFIVHNNEELKATEDNLIIRDEATNTETYRCPYNCGKIFKERGNLRIHIRLHTGEKPFKCTFENCAKSFISKGKLNIHINQHLGIKPYICQYPNCTKRYSGISRLKIHLRTHTGERPFKCPFQNCDKSFNEKGNLKTHMRIHTGEKPYECSFEGCHKRFKAKGHLTDHMKIHSKIKPFQCNICGGQYTRSSTLKIHSYTHLNIKPFKCPYKDCNRGFTEKGNMQVHIKTHRKDKLRKKKKLKKQKEEDVTEQQRETNKKENKINTPQMMINPMGNVNIWNCYFPYYQMNYQIINNINNVYYSGAQFNIQEKGAINLQSVNYINQIWNYSLFK